MVLIADLTKIQPEADPGVKIRLNSGTKPTVKTRDIVMDEVRGPEVLVAGDLDQAVNKKVVLWN